MSVAVEDGSRTATLPQDSSNSMVEEKVNEQYDSDASMAFYEHVMGGGGDDIHYGIFLSEDDNLKTSSQNSIEQLASMAVKCGALKIGEDNGEVRVLDLGSGKGGASRYLAATYGCRVMCFNLGERQNAYNVSKAEEAGIGHLIECHLGSFNEPLPAEWTDQYDMIWSQEAFCHNVDHPALMSEISRVLKPGGTLVFSDIMQGDAGGDCSSFTGQNVVAKIGSPATYKAAIEGCGMELVEHQDLTEHLTPYFQCMLQAVTDSKEALAERGVSMERLEAYEEDLATRFDAVKQCHFAWGMFSAKNSSKSQSEPAPVPVVDGSRTATLPQDSSNSMVEEKVNEQYDSDASMAFYEHVMGGGGDDIHYGIFLSDSDDLKSSSQNSIENLASMAVSCGALAKGADNAAVRVLDLGSGKGGASRYLAATYGCRVMCFNLGERQNAYNLSKAEEAGIGHLVECHLGSFNEPLPAEWTDQFDMVWSQEAFCHNVDHPALMVEVSRILKPGGTLVFSDIMQGDAGGDCSSFTGQNVVAKIGSPATYKAAIEGCGMELVEHQDLTEHLTPYFQCMLQAVTDSKEALAEKGVSMERLEAYEEDLATRFDAVKQRHFAWGMFSAKNPDIDAE